MTAPCRPPDPAPRPPRFQAPAGATDCHLHIFGPPARYPYVPERKYTPPDATPAAYRHLADTLGITRVVVVQASVYGFDNTRLLDALPEIGLAARAVVVVPAAVTDAELDRMHEAGVRGVRIIATHGGGPLLDDLETLAARIAARGWHVQFMLSPEQLLALEPRLAALPCPFVIDHFAGIPAASGITQPAFQALLRLMRTAHGWAKLSAAYHGSSEPPPYADLAPFAAALIATAPDRLVWGSDWPHVYFDGEMPNTTMLFDRLADWMPDPALRNRVLSDNPARLYGFGPP
jgi:predicted TIM-barrel fold metal-dependent hydrolase